MKNLNKVNLAITAVLVAAALALAIIFPMVPVETSESSVTLFDLPLIGNVAVSSTFQIIINVVAFFIFILYFLFECLRGRIHAGATMKSACGIMLGVAGVFGLGVLVTYISSLGAGIPFKFMRPMPGNGASALIMIVSFLLIAFIAAFVYLKLRSNAVRAALNSMRTSAGYTAANKFALTTAYAVMFIQFVIAAVLLGLLGDNQLFFVPLACGAISLAFWRPTNLKILMPVAIFIIILHATALLSVLACEMTIGIFGVIAADGILDLLLVLSLADLFTLVRK